MRRLLSVAATTSTSRPLLRCALGEPLRTSAQLLSVPSSRRGFAKKKKKGKKAAAAAAAAAAGDAGDSASEAAPSFDDAGGDEADEFDITTTREGMEKVLAYQASELGKLRPGRATASMFDHVQVGVGFIFMIPYD